MAYTLITTPQAEADLADAAAWYNTQQPGLGDRFAAVILAKLEAIQARPEAFPVVQAPARRAVVRQFPYNIFFRIVGDEVRVFAIIHGRRDPRRWQERLK